QLTLALGLVRAVTLETVVGEDRPDVAVEIDNPRQGAVGRGGGGHQAESPDERHAQPKAGRHDAVSHRSLLTLRNAASDKTPSASLIGGRAMYSVLPLQHPGERFASTRTR